MLQMTDLRDRLKRKRTSDVDQQQYSQDAQPGSKKIQATPVLLREYRQWKFARSLVNVFTDYGDGEMYYNKEKNGAEARNMLDRWLLSFQLDYAKSMDSRYPLFPQSLDANDPVNQKLMSECIEKKFSATLRNAREIFDELHSQLQDFLETKHIDERDARSMRVELVEDEDNNEAHVKMGEFESKHCWRVSFLVRNFGLLAAARMLMRYEALGTGSLQWGDPITVHNALHDLMGVRYEGFASPLNSKMIDKEDSRFCSLFIDTDEHFGSMGSFFKVDFEKCAGGWTVNPPFIEELMDRVARKVLEYLEKGGDKNWFFVTFPRWTDTPGWERLSKSHLCIDQIELDDGRFTVQDSYGRVFPPRNNLTIFVMGNGLPEGSSLDEIKETFRNLNIDSVKDEWQQTCRIKLDQDRRTRKAPPGAIAATAAAAAAAGFAPATTSLAPVSASSMPTAREGAPTLSITEAPAASNDSKSNPMPAVPIVANQLPKNRQLKRFANHPKPAVTTGEDTQANE